MRREQQTLGNFWVDLTRTCTRILLPIAVIAAVILMSQGVIQNFSAGTTARALDESVRSAVHVPGGPIASQESIKLLGTNGGGPFNANSAHPFENPNGWTNLLELYLLLLIPLALTVTFGTLAGSKRQGRVLLAVMMSIWLVFSLGSVFAEQNGNSQLTERRCGSVDVGDSDRWEPRG